MNTPTVVPLMICAMYVCWGMWCALFCHVVLRLASHIHRRWIALVADIIVGSVVLVCTVWYNNAINDGAFRLYILLAIGIGVAVYCWLCYRGIEQIWGNVVQTLGKK